MKIINSFNYAQPTFGCYTDDMESKTFLEQNVNNENKTQHNYKEQFSGVMIKKTALNIMINSKTKGVPSACQSLYFWIINSYFALF